MDAENTTERGRSLSRTLARLGALSALMFALWGPRVEAAGLLIADGGLGGTLEVKEHAVRVTITEGIAVTRVQQTFLNTENRQVEALYTFPVPKGASVANFSMWIGGKEMVGEVVEKERAREIYNSYKRVRRDPGLLEQVDYRTFEMRIFPIAPKAEQRVEVTYYQELDFDHDWATYVYPLASTTRRELSQRTTGRLALALEVKSEVPIVELESPSHGKEFAVAKRSEHFCEASLETRSGDLGRDFVLAYHVSRPKTGIDVLTSKQKGEDGYFALALTAGEELAAASSAMDYVFVADVSGSMKDEGKLELSRGSLASFVKALGAEDRFDIVTFNIETKSLFGKLTAAGEAATRSAEEFLASQEARGGTVLKPAVEAAYRYADPSRPLNVVILSDGLTDQGERPNLVALIRSRPSKVRVFCIGFGNDVNRGLLEQMAEDSGGLAAFLSREDNLARQAHAFRRKLLRPVATDLQVDFGGIDVYDVEPKRLPGLYHGTPVRLYGRYKGSGAVAIHVKAKVGEKPIEQRVEIPFPDEDSSSPEIERMWATRRVDRLLKEEDAGSAALAGEIVRLGELYSITTRYTSFLVLENDQEFQRWKIDRRNVLRLSRDRASQAELAAQLDALRSKAQAGLGPSAVPAEAATPAVTVASRSAGATPQAPAGAPAGGPSPDRPRSRSRDFHFGGGAFDPISVGAAIALAALGLAARRKVRRPDAAGAKEDAGA